MNVAEADRVHKPPCVVRAVWAGPNPYVTYHGVPSREEGECLIRRFGQAVLTAFVYETDESLLDRPFLQGFAIEEFASAIMPVATEIVEIGDPIEIGNAPHAPPRSLARRLCVIPAVSSGDEAFHPTTLASSTDDARAFAFPRR